MLFRSLRDLHGTVPPAAVAAEIVVVLCEADLVVHDARGVGPGHHARVAVRQAPLAGRVSGLGKGGC